MSEGGGKLGFIIFYVAFYLLVGFIGAGAASSGDMSFGVSGNVVSPPVLVVPVASAYSGTFLGNLGDKLVTILDYFIYFFSFLLYFVGLQGLTLFGLPSVYAVLISLPMTIGLVYVIASLLRGGS